VEVWRRHSDVAQAGNPEDVQVVRVLGHVEAALVNIRAAILSC
jgi:hypothetical protein